MNEKPRTVKGTITKDEQGEIEISLKTQKEPNREICPECGIKDVYRRVDGSIMCYTCHYTDRRCKPNPDIIIIPEPGR